MQTALHGVLGDAGQVVAADEVADDEDLGVPGHGQVGVRPRCGPARSDVAPSTSATRRANGTASTPAVHSTVRAAYSSAGPPAFGVTVTPSRRTSVTCTPMCSSTPSFSRIVAALSVRSGAKLLSTQSPPSKSSTRASSGSMLWNSLARARVAISRIWPASSTPVGPPPATAKVSHPSRSGPGGSVSAISNAPNSRRRMRQRVVEGLHSRRPLRELLVAEVGLPHAGGDDQHVVVERERGLVGAAGGDAARVGVEVDRLAEQGGDVAVAGQLLAQRAADLPDAQRPGGALVEQRLEHVARRAVEQRDVDVDLPEPARAEQPAEPAADDQHPRSTVSQSRHHFHSRTHWRVLLQYPGCGVISSRFGLRTPYLPPLALRSARGRGDAAVDGDHRSGEVGAGAAGEEHRDACHVVIAADPAKRVPRRRSRRRRHRASPPSSWTEMGLVQRHSR